MRLIHTADLHLDSSLKTNLDDYKRKERKGELTSNFARLSDTADNLNIKIILIAGDLFDTGSISKTVARAVLIEIEEHPTIDYYYLKGNHDKDSFVRFIEELGEVPGNLHMFDDTWSSYVLAEGKKRVVLTGAEFKNGNSGMLVSSLNLDPYDINIVMLHGQENEYTGKDTSDVIPITKLKGMGIDYLALGHIHERREGVIDSRGKYVYPGCLEGRGFDECGNHGFVIADIDEEKGSVSTEYVDFAKRRLHHLVIDVSLLSSSEEIVKAAKQKIAESSIKPKDYIKLELVGYVDEECEIDTDYITACFSNEYYFVKTTDSTEIKIDYEKFVGDESLKGWFIKMVKESDEMDEDTKAKVVRMGINALTDGEVTI